MKTNTQILIAVAIAVGIGIMVTVGTTAFYDMNQQVKFQQQQKQEKFQEGLDREDKRRDARDLKFSLLNACSKIYGDAYEINKCVHTRMVSAGYQEYSDFIDAKCPTGYHAFEVGNYNIEQDYNGDGYVCGRNLQYTTAYVDNLE